MPRDGDLTGKLAAYAKSIALKVGRREITLPDILAAALRD